MIYREKLQAVVVTNVGESNHGSYLNENNVVIKNPLNISDDGLRLFFKAESNNKENNNSAEGHISVIDEKDKEVLNKFLMDARVIGKTINDALQLQVI